MRILFIALTLLTACTTIPNTDNCIVKGSVVSLRALQHNYAGNGYSSMVKDIKSKTLPTDTIVYTQANNDFILATVYNCIDK